MGTQSITNGNLSLQNFRQVQSRHFYYELSTLGLSAGQFPTQEKALALFHDIYSKSKYFM